ncbi:MAG: hypothetical protein E6K96_06850 [Thaumarchaeota archaeon]|nr:MAG: hypothetical protein E6K96_06850 [Nitrososphaerota archaeon]
MELGEYQEIGSELIDLLRLDNPPVAISFTDTPPQGAKKNRESVPSGCVFWIRGFKETLYTDQRDHANCNIGSFTHGFLAPEKVSLDACVDIALFDKTGYFPASEFGGVPRMSEAPNFVAYGPLHKITFEPDVVLMVCNPQQAMLVGEAASTARLMGAPTCAAIPMAYNDHQVGISLGCVTNRIRTGIKPSEMVVTVPREELAGFTEKLRRRAKANDEVAHAVTAMLKAK